MSDRLVAVAVHESELRVAVEKTEDGPYAGRPVMRRVPQV
jgi:hypothetical protein